MNSSTKSARLVQVVKNPIFAAVRQDNARVKVCVALSGGVDSSVAALLLKRAGYDVFAMYMQNWHNADATLHGECEWEEERAVAELVARKVGIPFCFVDLSKVYRERVVDYLFQAYAAGRTPNPDVLCNREIKFDAFWKVARRQGADFVATGHYCRRVPAEDGSFSLLEGADPNKDQSYFLCRLTQEQLSHALFPIGGLPKPEVRRLAREAGLPSAERKDSQGICFVGKVDLPTFLKQRLAPKPGDVVEVLPAWYAQDADCLRSRALLRGLVRPGCAAPSWELPRQVQERVITSDGPPLDPVGPYLPEALSALSEEALLLLSQRHRYPPLSHALSDATWLRLAGRHEGAQFYTAGQRKGLGIGGHAEPLFVVGTDVASNIVYVGEGAAHPGLGGFCLRILPQDIHWVRPACALPVGGIRRLRVRIRYRQPLQGATLIMRREALYILFDTVQRSIAPGQFAAWYEGEELLGSGVIA